MKKQQKRTLEFAIIRYDDENYLCYKDGNEYVYVANSMYTFVEGEDEFQIIPPDFSFRKKIYTYNKRKVRIVPELYPNGWLAICAENPKNKSDYEALTVNLETSNAVGLPKNTFIDCNNQPQALKFLIKNKLVTDAHYKRQNGFVQYPMVVVDLVLLYQHDPEIFQKINIR